MSGTLTPTGGRIAGVASLTINGTPYDAKDITYNPSRVKRETQVGQTNVAGFSEMPVAGMIHATLFTSVGVRATPFNALTGATVVAQLANGTIVSGYNMWTTEVGDVNTTDGTFEVHFEGLQVGEN
jgi:hypothetical protein